MVFKVKPGGIEGAKSPQKLAVMLLVALCP
jgi:hypothetical protein